MEKVSGEELGVLISTLQRTTVAVPKKHLRRELRYTFFRNAKNILKQIVVDAIMDNLMTNREVKNYPEIAEHIAGIAAHYMNKMDTFYEITQLDFDDDGTLYQASYPDLSCLGDHADFIAGKAAGGAKDEASEKSARGWYFIYRDFEKNKKSLYPEIMKARISYWTSHRVAPMWYWFDEPISTFFAYPYQQVTNLTGAISDEIAQFIEDLENTKAQDEVEEELEVEITGGDSILWERLIFDVNIRIRGSYGEEFLDRAFVLNKLRRGEWSVTKTYVTRIGSKDVVIASIQRVTETGRKLFTGYRLEYE